MPGQARHDSEKNYRNLSSKERKKEVNKIACHAGLDPASDHGLENFFKTPYCLTEIKKGRSVRTIPAELTDLKLSLLYNKLLGLYRAGSGVAHLHRIETVAEIF